MFICRKYFNKNNLLYGLGLAVVLFTMASTTVQAEERELVLRLKWFHQFQFAGYYAAEKMGFYRDAGLNVTILPRDVKTSPVDDVLSGKADFGISDSSLVLRKLNGDNVVVLASIFQNSPLVFMSLADKQLASPLDFINKRVMFQKDVDDALFTAVFNEFGLSDSDYHYVPHNFDDDALIKGDVDVMSAYITDQPYEYQRRGYKVNIVNPSNYGIDFYGDMLFTSKRLIQETPEVATAFRLASIKGWVYALDNPEQVIEWIQRDYNTEKTREALIYEARVTRRVIRPKLVELGNINMGRFNRISDIYKEKGLAPKSGSLDGFNYQDYFEDNIALLFYLRGAMVIIIVVGLVLLVMLVLNMRLRQAVAQRTMELSQANKRLRRLIGFVSHDLRNPLGIILSTAQRLGFSKNKPDRIPEMIDMINSNAQQALELVQQVLDTSALGSGKLSLQLTPVDIGELIAQSVKNYEWFAERRNIQIQYSSEKSLVVEADHHRITQVLNNIVLNAVQHAPRDTVVSISTLVMVESITIRCVNQKTCVSEEVRKDSEMYRSIGFGMDIVSEILELHASEAVFEDTNNTFSVEFSLKRYKQSSTTR